jgi:hypothetical protein
VPTVEGVFMRDEAGAVQQIVSRSGVAVRQDGGAPGDASVTD